MAARDQLLAGVQALTFDVFGTVVDWRSSIETALAEAVQTKAASPVFAALPPDLQARARALTGSDYAALAQEWRTAYAAFTRDFVSGVTPWQDIDAHYHASLLALLARWQLDGLLAADEVHALSRAWHRLAPWPDADAGLRRLNARYTTATLSNGNQALLRDLVVGGPTPLPFARLLSAEDVHAYKPAPAVYLGAAAALGVPPSAVAMVAAHLYDLEAAHQLGLRTIYIERRGEEAWAPDEPRYADAKNWVDLWVSVDEDGLRTIATRLGL